MGIQFCIIFILIIFSLLHRSFGIELLPEYLNNVNDYETGFPSDMLNIGQKFLTPVTPDSSNVRTAENSVFKQKVDDISKRFRDSIENVKSKSKQVDVIFLIDSSSSIGKINFQSEIKFIKKLLSDFNVSYNYTRVALVTFSSQAKVIRHLDQISAPSEENDKCKLLNDDIPMLQFIGGGTFTYGALKEAEEILSNARNNSRKYIFLVTDGFSNGKNPISMSEKLKSNNVTIFTIGIQSGNSAELLNISSSPSNKHNFLLDSFFEFQSLARRALRTDYKIGENIKLKNNFRCSTLCEFKDNQTESCCDTNADCTCGTLSGHYACVCRPGYYGNGLRDQCFPCPNGTYWHISNMCRPCPDINHITIEQPALNLDQCTCKTGFRKTSDNKCEGITCPKLLPPENGYFVKQQGSCLNVLNAACGTRCMFGFQLIGTSLRLCQENGTWSGTEVSCVLKTCPILNVPYYGSIICRNRDLYLYFDYSPRNSSFMEFYEDEEKRITEPMPIDTECTYKCGPGYYLVGSRIRNCLPLSKWDGLHTTCKQIVCHPLPKPSYGEYEFADCAEVKSPYGTNCTLICPEGFTLKGPAMKTCGGKKIGVWSHKNKQQKCVDITPPNITCPENYNITMKQTDGEFVIIHNLPPPINVSDSSGLNVSVWLNPGINSTEGIKLSVGQHSFIYTASDVFSNKVECSFIVHVIDTIPPKLENCLDPEEFIISSNPNASKLERFIEWDEPLFYDNAGGNLTITRSLDPGYLSPEKYQVVYTAKDLSNNTNSCTLNITVKELSCGSLSSPINGYTFCAKNITHTWCEVNCNIGYGIFDEEQDTFMESFRLTCLNYAPKWKYDIIPDCTVIDLPNNIEQLLTISMDSENSFCNNSNLQNEVQNSFVNQIKKHLCNDLDDCEITSEIPECFDDPEMNPVSENTYYNIVKRDVRRSNIPMQDSRPKTRSNVRIRLFTRIGKRLGIWRKNNPLSDNVRRVKHELETLNTNEDLKQILSELRIDVRRLKVDDMVRCPDGSISRKYMCVQCPRGTYQDAALNRCELCPIGSYSDRIGQIHCTSCPPYHSTKKAGRQNVEECKQLCPPGSAAKTKVVRRRTRPGILNRKSLMPFCRKCNPGEYQPLYDETNCALCPPGYTSQRGSRLIQDCVPIESHYCQRDPLVCGPFGYCMPIRESNNLYRCICTEGYIGAHCEQKVDLCLSAPCYNNGVCYYVNQTSIACRCPPEFAGRFCEELKDSCNRVTCFNGGICLEDGFGAVCECPAGFNGRFCEQQDDHCSSSPCETGKCHNMPEGYECECPPGMMGKRCHLRPCDYLPCHGNAFCVDLLHSPTTRDSYVCKCPKGLKGYDCKQIDNPCDAQPCKNNGQCNPEILRMSGNYSSVFGTGSIDEDKYEQYTCKCAPYFYGKHCEILTTPDFVLGFSKVNTNNYVKLEGPNRDLNEMSFCAWIQTSDAFNYGSVISYATEDEDNTFTLTDYSGFVLYVNGNHTVTDMVVNDGFWHFVCVAWTSENGFFEIYLDGQLEHTGFNVSAGKKIPQKGTFIIGQEQDYIGGGFSESESFIGNIAYFDIWDVFLRGTAVQEFYTTCEPYQGSLYSWTDFKTQKHGEIEIKTSEFCRPCTFDLQLSNGFIRYMDNKAFHQCREGYNLRGDPIRYCLRTSQWSQNVPYCEIIDCNVPPPIDNGYVQYTSTSYYSEAQYYCNDGYSLLGIRTKTCLKNGKWSDVNVECISKVKCNALTHLPNGITVFYGNDNGYLRQNMSEFAVGTFAEITCNIDNRSFVLALLNCLEDGQWDGQMPVQCESKFTNLQHGSTISSQGVKNVADKTTAPPIQITTDILETTTKTTERISTLKTTTEYPKPVTVTTEKLNLLTSTKQKAPLIPIIDPTTPVLTLPSIKENTKKYFTTTTTPSTTLSITTIMEQSFNSTEIISDKDFWINLKSYLFSGCSSKTSRQSLFCDYQQDNDDDDDEDGKETLLRDLITFEPPDSSDFQNMDVKLLVLLKKHTNLIINQSEIPFEKFINFVLYGKETISSSDRFALEMEDSLRFVFCIYIDTIIWDDNLRFSTEEDDSSENITAKLKLLILKIAVPVYKNYKMRIARFGLTDKVKDKECNVQIAPQTPDNGIVVGILSKVGVENFNVENFRNVVHFIPVGSTVLYACKQGFRQEGNGISECDRNGIWTSIDYTCRFTGCNSPPKPVNMYFQEGMAAKTYKIGDKLHLRCKDGYNIHGNSELQCLATGKWTRVLARCTRISCNKPILPEDAEIIEAKSYLYEDKVLIACNNGNEIQITCQSNGTWSPRTIC